MESKTTIQTSIGPIAVDSEKLRELTELLAQCNDQKVREGALRYCGSLSVEAHPVFIPNESTAAGQPPGRIEFEIRLHRFDRFVELVQELKAEYPQHFMGAAA
jgi:hypothetical protein